MTGLNLEAGENWNVQRKKAPESSQRKRGEGERGRLEDISVYLLPKHRSIKRQKGPCAGTFSNGKV